MSDERIRGATVARGNKEEILGQGLLKEFSDPKCDTQCLSAWLENDGISSRERRSCLPERNSDREVPWSDETSDSMGNSLRNQEARSGWWNCFAIGIDRGLRVVIQDGNRASYFAAGFDNRFTYFAHDQVS